ncbi:MAG: major capsid protein [Lachnospiraceae bacterium]|nr:major capsid protein [Lachnospiraceae bacterium]
MRLRDAYSAKAIAIVNTNAASNQIPYLGSLLFPAKKKMGLDLKWIKTSKGLPVSLMPSAFDTKSTIRSREGIKIDKTEMAYFKESMLVKEVDEQEILRVKDSADPYAQEVLDRIFDDANTLVEGANVVPERMIMQLLNPTNGHPSISIQADGATYSYNYDPDNSYATNNYVALSSTAKWDTAAGSSTADPVKDIQDAQDAVEALTGTRPSIAIMSRDTFNKVKACPSVRNYILAQNVSATVMITDAKVKELFLTELGVNIIVYTKKFKTEAGVTTQFFADGYCALIPEGSLGNTWYGTTPDERTLMADPNYDTALVNTGVAVTVTNTSDPVQTKTTVSEIVLPSFERMDETYVIKAY